jgi:hypothetical protein
MPLCSIFPDYRSTRLLGSSRLSTFAPDLKRAGPLPASGPSNPDPGPIEGDRGEEGSPRSGLRRGMSDSGVTWLPR